MVQINHVTASQLCVFCLVRLRYLHGILLSINGMFRAGSAIFAPMQVELHSLVAAGQASA